MVDIEDAALADRAFIDQGPAVDQGVRNDLPELAQSVGHGELVAVYVPLSYMIGGVTLYLPRTELVLVDMPVENAMRLAITGGMSAMSDSAAPLREGALRR